MTHQENSRQELYYSPHNGWQGQEDVTAEYKLESSFATTHNFVVENILKRRNPRGGWDHVLEGEDTQLSSIQRGHVYRVKRKIVNDQECLAVKSMRFIDDEVVQVLQGLHVLAPDGKPVTELRLLKQEFLLPQNEESLFYERVKQIGGDIARSKSSLQSVYEKLKRINELFVVAKKNSEETETLVNKISDGVMIDAPTIDKYAEAVSGAYKEASRLLEKIVEETYLVEEESEKVEEKGQAVSYRDYAKKIYDQIEKIQRLQHSYEAQVAIRISDLLSDKLPALDSPDISRKLLFAPVVEYYLTRGFNCVLTETGLVIRVKDYTITMGDRITVKHGKDEVKVQGEKSVTKREAREL